MSQKLKSMFREPQSFPFRLWHWLNGLVILLLLGTVFLRKTFLSGRKMTGVIEEKLGAAGIALQTSQAKEAANAIRDEMWNWHFRLGFVLAGLLVFRLVFAKKAFPKVRASFIKGRHYGLVKSLYAAFYLSLVFMVVSGLVMYFSGDLHLSEELVDGIQEVHETFQWFFISFLVLHLGGVIRAEMTTDSGLVSDMIHGGETPESKQ